MGCCWPPSPSRLTVWTTERAAHRASAQAKSELRTALVERIAQSGPAVLDEDKTGGLAVLGTSGVDALDAYLRATSPGVPRRDRPGDGHRRDRWPRLDLGAHHRLTLPLIPVSWPGRRIDAGGTDRQIKTLQACAVTFSTLVIGLPTLKVFGRRSPRRPPSERSPTVTPTTMDTLRIAFFVVTHLGALATISSRSCGGSWLRLLGGHLEFRTALFVLVLAPEAYLPLRLLGTNYHASAEV